MGSSGRLLQALSGTVPGQRDRVHELGESKEISLLAEASEAVGLLEVEAVLEVPVEGLGIAPPGVEASEVRVLRRGRPQVFRRLKRPASSSTKLCSRTVISRVAYSLGISYWL